jgi:hypothetical protein
VGLKDAAKVGICFCLFYLIEGETMKTTLCCVAVLLGMAVAMTASPASAVVFLSDGFEYATDAAMAAAGWSSVDTPMVNEIGGQWKLSTGNHSDKAHYNPPTANGSASTGKFIISNSDAATGYNAADSGASHDLYTRSFSTVGNNKVWLHADIAAMLNQEGEAIFDIEVSNDNGVTWNNAFHRVCPDRGQIGHFDELPPVYTLLPTNENADGFHGRLDLNLSQWAADAANVKVRFRHYEPYDDWWVRMDNVLVDNVPVQHGDTTIFTENFNRPAGADGEWVGQMIKDGYHEDYPEEETLWVTWHATGARSFDEFGQYHAGEVSGQRRWVNRLEHSYHPNDGDPAGLNPDPDFAFIDCAYQSYNTNIANEYMMTPVLDCSTMTEVFLGYQDEIWWYTKNVTCTAEVLLMRDADGDGPDQEDEVVKVIFSYDQNAIGPEDGEDPWYAERLFSVPEAAGRDDVYFAWHYDAMNAPWWAIDSIKITGNPVPEPSTLTLLLGAATMVWLGRRRRR